MKIGPQVRSKHAFKHGIDDSLIAWPTVIFEGHTLYYTVSSVIQRVSERKRRGARLINPLFHLLNLYRNPIVLTVHSKVANGKNPQRRHIVHIH